MKTVLVTGANGQLGTCLKDVAKFHKEIEFIYTNSSELDITNKENLNIFFSDNNIDYCVNCAAYTAVDRAEEDIKNALNVNIRGAQNLAKICKGKEVILIHISTDFVFDGASQTPYKETDVPNPKSVYGETKLKGEEKIQSSLKNHYIIRTSWLYSEYGSNFMKTMLRLGKELPKLGVVNDQKGSPTYAKDLAQVIVKFINATNVNFGIYHYSNEGKTTWYEFAKEIFKKAPITVNLESITSADYRTAAERPKYSVLNTTKIKEALNIEIPNWKESLEVALNNFNKVNKA